MGKTLRNAVLIIAISWGGFIEVEGQTMLNPAGRWQENYIKNMVIQNVVAGKFNYINFFQFNS